MEPGRQGVAIGEGRAVGDGRAFGVGENVADVDVDSAAGGDAYVRQGGGDRGGVELSGVLVFNLSEDENTGDSFVSMSGEAGGGAFLATTKSQARRIGDC